MALLAVAQRTALALIPFAIIALYIHWNDKALKRIPASALYFSPKRCSAQDVRAMAESLANSPPLSIKDKQNMPPRTGRRYIVVGGGGFLGGWVVTKLLERGENPHHIRILNTSPPVRNYVVKDSLSTGVQFIKVDMTDAAALQAAFKAPWPKSTSSTGDTEPEITVFHTAAKMLFYERHLEFLYRSTKVNVRGTQNVVDAARAVGATILVYTSSGGVGVHRTRLFLWPWETEPERLVQIINDTTPLPKRHEEFPSNYSVTKMEADRLVRAADRSSTGPPGGKGRKVLRTGCIRAGNGIFGPRGDQLCTIYLGQKLNPSWTSSVVHSFSYVENCASAHLCYEARLVDLLAGSTNPDIGGQAFFITDPGKPPTFGDIHTTLETLTEGECRFPLLSPTTMLIIAHFVEMYYRWHHKMVSSGWSFAKKLPEITGLFAYLQPAAFAMVSVHVIYDDSRARLPPEKGGLGYSGAWTTLEGIHRTYEEYKSRAGK